MTRVRMCLAIYILCFSVGVVTHSLDFLARGLRPYSFAPPFLETFWSALVLLDALTVVLLLTGRRRAGLVLAVSIMVSDVAINSYAHYVMKFVEMGWAIQLQSLFLGFVIGSAALLWPQSADPLKASIAAQP